MDDPTPLTDIHLPESAITELETKDIEDWITNHAISVSRRWWADQLAGAGLADTVAGAEIRRGDIFELAGQAQHDPDAALTLLWNSLAWGSGKRNRNNSKRIVSVAEGPVRAGELLMRAAALSRTSPVEAYELLYPRHRGAIRQLGPAFFTKYLYFAGGGDPDHPCAILDVNVARALKDSCGWRSLRVNGGWDASTYGDYCVLLDRWVTQYKKIRRRDGIERWLFDEGKRLAVAAASGRAMSGV